MLLIPILFSLPSISFDPLPPSLYLSISLYSRRLCELHPRLRIPLIPRECDFRNIEYDTF